MQLTSMEPHIYDLDREDVTNLDKFLKKRHSVVTQFMQLNYSHLKVTSTKKRQLLKMCHLKHRLRIFSFCKKVMFRSQDIQAFIFLTIPRFTKSVTS